MNSKDFFAKVDADLRKAHKSDADTANDAEVGLTFVKEVVSRLGPLTTTYEQEMRSRGITVAATSSDRSIQFQLTFKDGGHHAITLHAVGPAKRIEITGNYTNDDGRDYSSTDGQSYDAKTWNDEIFVSKLQKCIQDFIFYADRHQGM